MANQDLSVRDGSFQYRAPDKVEYDDVKSINHGGKDQSRSEFSQELDDGTLIYGWKSADSDNPLVIPYAYHFMDKKVFTKEECDEWGNYILQEVERTKQKGIFNLGQLNILRFDFHLVEPLKAAILDGIKTLLSITNNDDWQIPPLHANGWYNVFDMGEGMPVHSHGYYKNGFLGFNMPIWAIESFTSYYHPIKFQPDMFNVPNKIGWLTLFPAITPHSVSENKYKKPRISLAGDVGIKTWSTDISGGMEVFNTPVTIVPGLATTEL